MKKDSGGITMALQYVHARAIFTDSGDRSLKYSNGFTFLWTDVDTNPDSTDYDVLTTAVEDFYNEASGSQMLGKWMGQAISRGSTASELTLTDITGHLDGSPAGSPFSVEPFELESPTGTIPND
jgi:hypothetical protein